MDQKKGGGEKKLMFCLAAVNDRYLVSVAELRARQSKTAAPSQLEKATDISVIEAKMSQFQEWLERLNPFGGSRPQDMYVSVPREQELAVTRRVLRVCPEARVLTELEASRVKQINALDDRERYVFLKAPLSCADALSKLRQ